MTFSLREDLGALCALEVRQVESVVPSVTLARVPDASPGVVGLINVHGDILPVLDLSPWFGLPPRPQEVSDFIIILRRPRGAFGILVADVGDVRWVDAQTGTAGVAVLPGLDRRLAGVVALDDGTLLLCDVPKFLAAGGDELLDSIPGVVA